MIAINSSFEYSSIYYCICNLHNTVFKYVNFTLTPRLVFPICGYEQFFCNYAITVRIIIIIIIINQLETSFWAFPTYVLKLEIFQPNRNEELETLLSYYETLKKTQPGEVAPAIMWVLKMGWNFAKELIKEHYPVSQIANIWL